MYKILVVIVTLFILGCKTISVYEDSAFVTEEVEAYVLHKCFIPEEERYRIDSDFAHQKFNIKTKYTEPEKYLVLVKLWMREQEYRIDNKELFQQVEVGQPLTLVFKCFKHGHPMCWVSNFSVQEMRK